MRNAIDMGFVSATTANSKQPLHTLGCLLGSRRQNCPHTFDLSDLVKTLGRLFMSPIG